MPLKPSNLTLQKMSQGEAYNNFASSIRSHSTLKTYRYRLAQYAERIRKTADLDQIIADDLLNPKQAEKYIKQFIASMKATRLTEVYISGNCAALRHFYDINDVVLNWRKLTRFQNGGMPDTPRAKDRAYTHEEIQKMLEAGATNTRTRAIILLLASTGCRIGAVHPLRLRNLSKVDSYGLYRVTIYENTSEEYITFCTPEAARAIDSYLELRSRAGEILNQDSPLFRQDFDASDHLQARNNVRPLKGPDSLTSTMRRILQQQTDISPHVTLIEGQKPGSITKQVHMWHGFRKFANTQMVKSEMNIVTKEMLLGHSVGLDDRYYRPTPNDLLDQFLRAVDLLTINEENRLRKKVEVLKAERDEIEMLKGRVQQKEDRLSVIEKQMQSLVSTLSKLTEQGQVNTVAQTLYSSGILKEGKN
jgi:integrase